MSFWWKRTLVLPSLFLYADNHVANDSHTWTVPEKLLVCGFRIKLLSLYELVVEVNVIPLAFFSRPVANRQLRSSVFSLSAVLKS